MNRNKILVTIVVVIALLSVIYSFMGSDDSAYIKQIEQKREEKNNYMRTAADSPFAQNAEEFKGLNYFPPDITYKVKAKLNPIENKKIIELQTSDGKAARYMEYAHAAFNVNGKELQLLILEIIDMGPYRGTLFLAFGDETSTRETYGAGRYLDVKKTRGQSTITLDFNEAYNPYCAYNETYSCPLPPLENLLPVAINAGEKNYY